MSDKKKLLHERLRECKDVCYICEEVLGLKCSKHSCHDWISGMADEIEREYLPRPMFEDGAPVQFGNVAAVRDEIGEVAEMRYQDDMCVEVVIGFEWDSHASHYMCVDGEFLKRPAPKPLDADGAPIEVGDTVWSTDPETGYSAEVICIVGDHAEVIWEDGESDVGVSVKSLTHRRPVLDAVGVEIKPGETVYGLGREPHTYTVQKAPDVNEDVGHLFCVRCYDVDDGCTVLINPSNVSHEKPVFDADGVRCVLGEDVWCTRTGGYPCKIIDIDPDTRMCAVEWIDSEAFDSWLRADCITHEKPVFDVDGAMIRKGDTVWRCDSGERFTADRIDDSHGVVRVWHYCDGSTLFSYPGNLTHKPESLESLLGYVRKVNDSEIDADCSAEHCLMKIEARLENLVKQSRK